MSDVAIEVTNLSKLYRLGTIGTGSLRQDVYHWWNRAVRKKDTLALPGLEKAEGNLSYIWALNDVSFSVKHGEVLGIIGSNGSGKSTLLKIIARIVHPTKGMVRGKGKISSILEIGTGFHAELSGRENIFMSGYTLGMTRQEIRRKFDEIVSFSGIEQFLDTPVKRYSSGMYVRLAFAVAAHIEPDILIVDEVLAVGDAEFQQRCLGKMKQVSNQEGRTVLFVSHNLPAVANLCTNALWLNKGKLVKSGPAASLVKTYLGNAKHAQAAQSWSSADDAPGNDLIRLKTVSAKPGSSREDGLITVETSIDLEVEFWCFLKNCTINVNVGLFTNTGECVFNMGTHSLAAEKAVLGLYAVIPENLLNNGGYTVSLTVIKNGSQPVFDFTNCLSFEVEDVRDNMQYFGKWQGIIRPRIESYLWVKGSLVSM